MCDYREGALFFDGRVISDARMRGWGRGEKVEEAGLEAEVARAGVEYAESIRGDTGFPEAFPFFDPAWPAPLRETWRHLAIQCGGFLLTLREWERRDQVLFRRFGLVAGWGEER